MNDHPFLLYQACIMRPYSFYDTPLLYTLKLDSALLFIYNIIIIIGNVYLFLFLQSQTENNTALSSVDKKKERKRNFVSAKSGIICGFVLAISTFVYTIFYGLKVHFNINSWSKANVLFIVSLTLTVEPKLSSSPSIMISYCALGWVILGEKVAHRTVDVFWCKTKGFWRIFDFGLVWGWTSPKNWIVLSF